MNKIFQIASQLEAAGVEYALDDRTDGIRSPSNPYLRLKDWIGDIGAIILTRDDRVVYFFWESLAGCHTKDFEFISTDEFRREFDRFILTFYRATPMPNPYFI